GTRKAQAISKVMAASRIRVKNGAIESAAIALGSVAPTPVRLTEVEAFLAGKKLTSRLINEAEKLAQATVKPIADIRSSAEYRRWTSGRLVRDALENL
ncbi:MAG: xanthine dehydrogenase family protein subunit M, partial [Lentisphaerae bacterium]|nr:xanthine dehydrogenase family protein subunit M [Lentisphaerota bacterium]